MKQILRYVFSTLLLCTGVYYGYNSVLYLNSLVANFPVALELLQTADLSVKFNGWDLYCFEFAQTVCMFVFAILCICASQKRFRWFGMLFCGIMGVTTYAIATAYVAYVGAFSFKYLLFQLRFAIIPIFATAFSFYYRAHPNCILYHPIPLVPLAKRLVKKLK